MIRGNVAYAGFEEAQDFTSVGLPSAEGIGRKRNTRDCSGSAGFCATGKRRVILPHEQRRIEPAFSRPGCIRDCHPEIDLAEIEWLSTFKLAERLSEAWRLVSDVAVDVGLLAGVHRRFWIPAARGQHRGQRPLPSRD